jgi:DNA-binding NarL/FixJ family response regulator
VRTLVATTPLVTETRELKRRFALFAGGSDNGGPRSPAPSIRVLVAGGYTLTRRAIVSVLEHEGGIQPVGEAENEAEALRKAAPLHADIIVIMGADADGRMAINLMTARHPVKVLMLRDGARPKVTASFVHPSGPNVPADITPMTIGDAVRAMHTGRLGPLVETRLMSQAARSNGRAGPTGVRPGSGELTERERDVLAAVAHGLSDKEIAARLFLSESTIKTHLKNLYRRFNLRNRAHAAVFACERGVRNY